MKRYLITIVIILCLGCATKQRTETEVRYVTIEKTDTLRDSVFVEREHTRTDSIIIYAKGDTIYRDRFRTIYVGEKQGTERERVVIRHDTIQVARDVYVERKPSAWERIKRDTWLALLGAAVVLLAPIFKRIFTH